MAKLNLVLGGLTSWKHSAKEREIVNSKAFQYLKAYFDVSYYTCFLPFRLEYNYLANKYEVVRSKIQKILCISYHIFYCSYYTLCHGYSYTQGGNGNGNQLDFFANVETILDLLFVFIVFHTVFFKFNKLEKFLQLAQDKHTVGPVDSLWKYVLPFIILITFWVYGSIMTIQDVATVQSYIADEVITKFSYSADKKRQFFDVEFDQKRYNNKLLSPLGIPMQLFLHAFFGYAKAVAESTTVIFFAFGIILRDMSESIRGKIVNSPPGRLNPTDILDDYLHVKKVSNCMNELIENIFPYYVLGSVPFLAKLIINLGDNDLLYYLRVFLLTAYYIMALVGSASANEKASSLKDELLKHRADCGEFPHEKQEFIILLTELSTPTTIGLKGNHFFLATYSFFGLMFSQCLVYALILLQFMQGSKDTMNENVR